MFLGEYLTGDGRLVVLREPRLSDVEGYVALKNRLVEEDADVDLTRMTNSERETEWLQGQISRMDSKRTFFVVAEHGEILVGHSFVNPRRGKSSHVAEMGIMVDRDYRDVGLGSEMIKLLESTAVKQGIESVILEVFESNKRARRVYSRLGYREVGVYSNAIKHKGAYLDSVIMQKTLDTS